MLSFQCPGVKCAVCRLSRNDKESTRTRLTYQRKVHSKRLTQMSFYLRLLVLQYGHQHIGKSKEQALTR